MDLKINLIILLFGNRGKNTKANYLRKLGSNKLVCEYKTDPY